MAIWHLNRECHSLLLLYRFKNKKLEAKYQSDRNHYNVYSTQVNYYFTMLLTMMNCISYMGPPIDEMPGEFWFNFAITLISFLFAMSTAFVKPLQKRALLVHFIYCSLRIGIFASLIPLSANLWYSLSMQAWVPSGSHLLMQDAAGNQSVADASFSTFLKSTYSNVSIVIGYQEVVNIWMFFAMTGLNVYTLLGYSLLLAALIPCITLVPYYTMFGLANCLTILVCTTCTYLTLALIIERIQRTKALVEYRLEREMRASQTADSVLNHSLKNTMADVAGHIETFLGGAADRSALEDALSCLRRGMRICKERQVFLQLAAGEYRPMRNVVPLREFGEQLLAGRNVLAREGDNAISNAFKHGCPGDPQVEFEMAEAAASRGDHHRVEFIVRNAANPAADPLTPAFVDDLLSGRLLPKRDVPVLSNGIGFSHALMAAKLAGVTINLQQEGSVVSFIAWMDLKQATTNPCVLEMPSPVPSSPSSPSLVQDFPRGLRFFVLDDSNVARRYMQFLITSWCDPSVVRCFGAQDGDVGDFLALAPEGADVVIVDQHLEYTNQSYLGTDVIERLQCLGFLGFICIRSADDGTDDRQGYLKHGAHCAFGKNMQGVQFITQLKEAYVEYHQALRPQEDPSEETETALQKALTWVLHPPPEGRSTADLFAFTSLRAISSTVHPT
eukprot:EG_transcript_5556